jgi:enoyl-CoA hydratase
MPITLEKVNNHTAVMKIERPEVRNALDRKTMETFRELVEHAHTIRPLHALIITGGKDIFIAGGDLKTLHQQMTERDGRWISQTMSTALNRLEALPCPTIAAINGPARGGGAEIALACDLRVMDSSADLGFVQINLALVTGWGTAQRLMRMVGYSRALEWLTTAAVIDAELCNGLGLANRQAPLGEALPEAITLAEQINAQSHEAVRAIKRMLRGGLHLPPATALAGELAEFPPLWAADEHRQAVDRFLNRRQ